MGYFWNRKTGVLLAGLCIAGAIHVLVNTHGSHVESSTSISSLHSKINSKTSSSRSEDKPSLVEKYVVPSVSRQNKKVIILSYMRSGSTLVGDIIQSHPEVFYVYEPLLYLWDYYVPKKMNVTHNLWTRTKTFWKRARQTVSPPLDFITYMFNCNLTATNLKFLTNSAHSRVFRSARCPIYRNGMHIVDTSDHCVNTLTTRCSEAKTVLLKVVRLSMAEADRFLEKNSDVKIIHLIRDPRGVLLSRIHFNDKETGEMHKNYSNICRRILEDVQVSQSILYKHRGKILTVRYEDLAQNLEGFTKKILKFADLSMELKVLQHLKEITSSDDLLPNKRMKAKKTTRKDPYKTAYHWRSTLPFPVVEKVDKACRELYKLMGYREFVTEADLRNENLSARSRYYGDDLLTALR